MPYIKQEDRDRCCPGRIAYQGPRTAGELNYAFTQLCIQYFTYGHSNYQGINDILGALEGCKLEFYRRLVSSYEDQKIKENGDVY